MNILIFVMTMLLLLSTLTYARLENFRSSQVFDNLFQTFSQDEERSYINSRATKAYTTTVASSKKGGGKENERVQATPRVNISLIVNAENRDNKGNESQQIINLLKNLISILYSEQPFYKEMESKRPGFVDEIFLRISQVTSELPDNKKIKTASDLANLSLGDSELDEVFYKMLHGAYKADYEKKVKNLQAQSPGEQDQKDQAMVDQLLNEHQLKIGYYSLLDYITVSPGSKIRIFLAPREVLKAIYNDSSVVDEIIKERQNLYKALVADDEGNSRNSLKVDFQKMFDGKKDPAIDTHLLDYSVTKTNPKKYE